METVPLAPLFTTSAPLRMQQHRCRSAFPSPFLCRPGTVASASKGKAYGYDSGSGGGGGLVDQNMAVLRRRIREMRTAEGGHEPPPSHWMGWEKRCHASYGADVCRAVGVLQVILMNTRPSLGIGVVALVMFSVPTSVILILLHVIDWVSYS